MKWSGVVVCCVVLFSAQADADIVRIDGVHRQFLKSHCVKCHNAKTTEGETRLDQAALSFDIETVEDADKWQSILDAINAGEMPPEDEPQPRDNDKLRFLEMLSNKLVETRSALSDSGGKVVIRRLNRREYQNSMKHILGVDVDITDLPDDQSESFDTDGASLFMSPYQLEQYLDLGREAIRTAMSPANELRSHSAVGHEAVGHGSLERKGERLSLRIEPEVQLIPFVQKRADDYRTKYEGAQAFTAAENPDKDPKDFGLIDERDVTIANSFYRRFFGTYDYYLKHPLSQSGALLSLWHPKPMELLTIAKYRSREVVGHNNNGKPLLKNVIRPYPSGIYKVRAGVGRTAEATPERCFLDFGSIGSGGGFNRLHTYHITATAEDPQIVEATIVITPEDRKFAFREKSDNGTARYKYTNAHKTTGHGPEFALWIDWIEFEGPFAPDKTPMAERLSTMFHPDTSVMKLASSGEQPRNQGKVDADSSPANASGHKKSLAQSGTQHQSAMIAADEVKTLLRDFASLAFRGAPDHAPYLRQLYSIYKTELASGKPPAAAIVEPLAIILASPEFLYLSEPVAEGKRKTLSQRELAIRLSYFLWSSPPDDTLLLLAQAGQLKGDDLNQQVNRLLGSPRAEDFYRSFAYQWLDMERLSLFQFDVVRYTEFDDTLKSAAAEEIYQTLKVIVDEDLSSKTLLDSDFVVVNALLAQHYGLLGVNGDHFRKVALPKDSLRGGLTSMAAVMAMGSDGKETSPVERGAWVLRKILNRPPPPPPPNVPQLNRLEGKKLTVKQMLAAHQEEPQCAHCHKRIDPIGFGLENFDPTGLWRTEDRLNKVKVTIDPSGCFYTGESFADYRELKQIFVSQLDEFNRGLIEHLLSYSLGRPVGFSDEELVEELHNLMKQNNNSIRALIQGIVQSEAFRSKK